MSIGPCLCGDPYCPRCGDPEAAAREEWTAEVLDELRRWCRHAGYYYAAAVVKRWMDMPEEDKASLRARWAQEDQRRIERHGTG